MAVGYGNWKPDPRYRKASDFGKRLWPEDIPENESMIYSHFGVRSLHFMSSQCFWDWFDKMSSEEKRKYWWCD